MKAYVLCLKYDIMFEDADDGKTYAGDGQKILGIFRNAEDAQQVCAEYNPILSLAEKERIVFPVQQYNQKVLDRFGFTLDSLDQNGENFVLSVQAFDLV